MQQGETAIRTSTSTPLESCSGRRTWRGTTNDALEGCLLPIGRWVDSESIFDEQGVICPHGHQLPVRGEYRAQPQMCRVVSG